MPLIWLAGAASDEIASEVDRAFPLETGGVLLGYASGPDVVVSGVLGPGPAARHRRRWFEPDHTWHAERLRRLFDETAGRTYYIGDWHSHPDGALALSGRDRRALRRIIRSREAATAEPVSGLMAGRPGDWAFAAWRASLAPRRWRFDAVTLERLTQRRFDEEVI